jgi:hypothetical protein
MITSFIIHYANAEFVSKFLSNLEHGQLQLILVCADGMQVGADKCRLIFSYRRFEVGAGCS